MSATNEQQPLLSIIIVSWNTADLLAQCLDSIAAPVHANEYEVWVVDNVSEDESVALVRRNYPWVHLIENEENVGFARANNQAIARARGKYILLLNPDTVVEARGLEELVAFMEQHPAAGAAGSKLLNPNGTLQPSCHPFPTLTRELWRLLHLDRVRSYGVYDMHSWAPNRPRPVDVIQGASFILRRAIIDQIGVLDESYFIYSEEVDWCYRIKQAGWQIFWVPASRVVHFGGQSTKQVATKMFLNLYRYKVLYFRKHHGWLAAQVYKLILFVAALVRLAASPVAIFEREPQREQHRNLAANYWRLVRMLPSF